MKNNKKVFILLGVLIVILLIVAIAYKHRDRRTYELNLPQAEDLSKIELKRNDMSVGIYQISADEYNSINVYLKNIEQNQTTSNLPI